MDEYRVLPGREDDELLLLDPETADPVYVATDGYDGHLARTVARVVPGNRVRAALDWSGPRPRFTDLAVTEATTFRFTRGATDVFQAALECMGEAEREGVGMNSRVTHGQDGQVNGVCYAFAQQPGARDLFTEFRDGEKPLDPLLARIEGAAPPYDVFVIEPRRQPFVLVYIVLEPGGLLATTVYETYFEGQLADRLDATDDDVAGEFDVFDGL